jgi:hypothetical protein
VFVRLKTRYRRAKWAGSGTVIQRGGKTTIVGDQGLVTYAAQLVESWRDNAGKPRQSIVRHLATIQEAALQDEQARAAFWAGFLRNLYAVGLLMEECETLIGSVTARVPFPSPRAHEKYLRERGAESNSVYRMRTRDGFRTVVRSRPRARPARPGRPGQHAQQDRA